MSLNRKLRWKRKEGKGKRKRKDVLRCFPFLLSFLYYVPSLPYQTIPSDFIFRNRTGWFVEDRRIKEQKDKDQKIRKKQAKGPGPVLAFSVFLFSDLCLSFSC